MTRQTFRPFGFEITDGSKRLAPTFRRHWDFSDLSASGFTVQVPGLIIIINLKSQ